jgi:D-tyrosyl-tRNA(Tyr) deacylase
MKAVIQRVSSASVHVAGELISEIGPGVLTLLGVKNGDTEKDAEWLMRKIVNLRIFEDDNGKMNRSLNEVGGSHLIVSQFTLWADASKGNRPSYIEAARPEYAKPLYERSIALSNELGVKTFGGRFQARMRLNIVNEGPVTILLSSVSG